MTFLCLSHISSIVNMHAENSDHYLYYCINSDADCSVDNAVCADILPHF